MNTNPSFKNIPEELKKRRQWTCYRIEDRDGKKPKIPYRTDKAGRKRAKSNAPATWHTFEEVVEAVGRPENRFDGIGFMLSHDDPYTFIDLDDVVGNGTIEKWAQDIIDQVKSYTELSQSGTGIHIIARGKKAGTKCRTSKQPKFEIYDEKRFVVFTGKLLPESPAEVTDAQEALDNIYLSTFGDNAEETQSSEVAAQLVPVDISDSALIEKASTAENGFKFEQLWNGNTASYNGDDSAADMALCCMLAFWTRKDSSRMDRLFRQSGLMRPKWDQKRGKRTYGQMTIDNAIKSTTEVYGGQPIRPAADEELAAARDQIAKAKDTGTAAAVYDVVDELSILPLGEYNDVAGDLKKTIPQLDLRELKGAVSKSRKRQRAGDIGAHPELVVSDRQLRDMGNEAISLLKQANVPPTLFVRSGTLCRLVEDERGHPMIEAMTEDTLLARLSKNCDFVTETRDGPKNVMPPKSIATYILAESQWPFPALEAISQSPTIRPDGSVAQVPGYDPATKLYYHWSPQDKVEVPECPTNDDVHSALSLLDEMLHDFPFDREASRTNALALLLSPLIQSATADRTPLFLIDAPTAGSGKSLLATVVGIVSSGAVPDFTTAPTRDEEWPKKITAILSSGGSFVVIDNVKYCLQNAEFAMLLTARTWKDRVFGKNTETVALPNRTVWVATGNNIQLGSDIPRRCVWIRIDPRQSKPHERSDFAHPDLEQWVLDNRPRLLSALLVLCRNWFAGGCAQPDVPAFGSFQKWAQTIGGILASAGVTGFLENRDTLWEQSDTESAEWEAFLSTWIECYGTRPVRPKELVQDIQMGETIADAAPAVLSDAVYAKGDHCSRIGKQFRKRLEKRHGPRGLRLERGSRKGPGVTWVVLSDEESSECRVETTPYTDSTVNSCVEHSNSVGCAGSQTPNAGAEHIISEDGEIITHENGLDPKRPTQPYTLHEYRDENYEDFKYGKS